MTHKTRVERMRQLGMGFLFLHEENPDKRVNMAYAEWHVCGTVACHAGYFADLRGVSIITDMFSDSYYDFIASANDMAQFLGFYDKGRLKDWANDYPHLWGNVWGFDMFCTWNAFGFDNARTLKTIGKHWLAVAERYAEAHGVKS